MQQAKADDIPETQDAMDAIGSALTEVRKLSALAEDDREHIIIEQAVKHLKSAGGKVKKLQQSFDQ